MECRSYLRKRLARRDIARASMPHLMDEQANTRKIGATRAKVATNLGGKKGQLSSCRNPAYDRAWKGYEYLNGFEAGKPFLSQDCASCIQKELSSRKAEVLSEACVVLSVLAHCKSVEQAQERISKCAHWGPNTLGQAITALRVSGKALGVASFIWTISLNSGATPAFKTQLGKGERAVHYLFVEDPNQPEYLHVLPVAKPEASFKLPATFREQRPSPQPEARTAVSVVKDKSDVSDTAAEADGRDLPVVWMERPEADSSGARPDEGVLERSDSFESVTIEEVLALDGVTKPVYCGIRSGPPCFDWKHGWWPSQCPTETGDLLDRLAVGLFLMGHRPDVCSAILPLALQHGNNCLYLPVHLDDKIWLVRTGSAVITDGSESTEAFFEGDIVVLDGHQYLARKVSKYGVQLLELVYASAGMSKRQCDFDFGGSVRTAAASIIPFLDTASEARVIPKTGKPKVAEKTVQKALWTAVIHREADPLKLAQLQRMRQDAATAGYADDEAQACLETVNQLALTFPEAGVVAGIPECFSCGTGGPGTYKGKLCKACSKGRNSRLGVMVAEGLSVAGPGCKVVYPGVVNTRSRHPPLKEGVESFATERSFQLSRVGEQRLRPHLPLRG